MWSGSSDLYEKTSNTEVKCLLIFIPTDFKMVNTFVISGNPKDTARVLDNKRLNSQRREAKVIIDSLKNKKDPRVVGRKNQTRQSIFRMWEGHRHALKYYFNLMRKEWIRRGYKCEIQPFNINKEKVIWPWWVSCRAVHASHKHSLLYKEFDHYTPWFKERDSEFRMSKYEKAFKGYGYVWPTKLSEEHKQILVEGGRLHPSLICSPLGKGTPSHMRLKKKYVEKWVINRNINPQTGKLLRSQKKGSIYDDYKKAAIYYDLI